MYSWMMRRMKRTPLMASWSKREMSRRVQPHNASVATLEPLLPLGPTAAALLLCAAHFWQI